MARVYRLTSDISEKEKAVGGLFTFAQTGWLALGLVIFAAVAVALSRMIPTVLAFLIGLIPGLAVALPFAFYEKGGLKLSSYLFWRMKFALKPKALINTMTYKLDRPKEYAAALRHKESGAS